MNGCLFSVCLCARLYVLYFNIAFFPRICAEMAELSSNAREYEKAINFYKEGLTYDETHLPVSVNVPKVFSLGSKAATG